MYQLFTVDLPQALHPHPPHSVQDEGDCDAGTVTTFVDDGSAIVKARSPAQLGILAQRALDNLGSYLTSNRLKINSGKSQLLVVNGSNRNDADQTISLKTDTKIIHPVLHIRLLGVQLSHDLKWDRYIDILYGQLTYRLSTLKNIAKFASKKVLRQISEAILWGKLNFALALWAGISKKQQQKFHSLILSAARLCLGPKSFRWSAGHMLSELNWMSFAQKAEFFTSQMIHQTVTTGKPELLNVKINLPLCANTRAAKNGNLQVPTYKRKISKFSFHHRGVLRFNQIPAPLKAIKNKNIFKRKLKLQIKSGRSYYLQDMAVTPNPFPSSDDSNTVINITHNQRSVLAMPNLNYAQPRPPSRIIT